MIRWILGNFRILGVAIVCRQATNSSDSDGVRMVMVAVAEAVCSGVHVEKSNDVGDVSRQR